MDGKTKGYVETLIFMMCDCSVKRGGTASIKRSSDIWALRFQKCESLLNELLGDNPRRDIYTRIDELAGELFRDGV